MIKIGRSFAIISANRDKRKRIKNIIDDQKALLFALKLIILLFDRLDENISFLLTQNQFVDQPIHTSDQIIIR